MKELLNLDKVSYLYDDKKALDDISIRIYEGDSIAILGTNGSGKSTLLKLLSGLVIPNTGAYSFQGTVIDGSTLKDRLFIKAFHKKIGFLFQNVEHQLFCTSVHEEVSFGPRQLNMEDNEIEKRVNDCLSALNISHLKERVPYHLSEGEKKKVALAAVLALNPEVLVLDEPFNGLDNKTRLFILDFMKVFSRSGKTIICALHDLTGLTGTFNRVIELSSTNKLVFDGTCEDFNNKIE